MNPFDSPEAVELRCSTCGSIISFSQSYWGGLNTDFITAERMASVQSQKVKHQCAYTPDILAKAKEMMIEFRNEHSYLTFEQQCQVYANILRTLLNTISSKKYESSNAK